MEQSLRWKNLLAWQTIVFVKQENIEKKFNKAYYGENEIVTLVNIFVGGTFPFQQGIFMQSWKGRWYVRSIFPKSVTIDQPNRPASMSFLWDMNHYQEIKCWEPFYYRKPI